MNRYIVLALLLAVSLCPNAGADDARRDGNWWRTETASFKWAYLGGFFDGMDLGKQFSYWGLKDDPQKSCAGKVLDSFSDYKKKYFSNVTNIQLADGLDAFYEDYRNRRILVSDAVWLVVNSIAGTPQKDLDRMIENWRKNVTE